MLVAVGYGLYRRLVQQPARLEPNREALVILALIAAIMVTDFLFDGFRFALRAGRRGDRARAPFAPVGGAVARHVGGLSPRLLAGLPVSYWLQMLTVLSFLVLLPVGEHFHIVTALPALFFRRGGPANGVPAVDLDRFMRTSDAAEMKIGARTARDLDWKDGLDAFTCTECGRCKDACPTFLTGKPLSMKWVNDSLKHHLLEHRAAIVAGGAAAAARARAVRHRADTLWACTTCGYCEAACPIELEHLPRFFRMRQHRVLMDGEFPHELKSVFHAYEAPAIRGAFRPIRAATGRAGSTCPSCDAPRIQAAVDYLFYVGSAESFDPRGQKIARAFVAILRRRRELRDPRRPRAHDRRVRTPRRQRDAVPGARREAGRDAERARRHADRHLRPARAQLAQERVPGVRWPLGGRASLAADRQLLTAGRIRLDRALERVIYTTRATSAGTMASSMRRARCWRTVRDAPLEFPLSREKAMCCGAGGARMWMEETLGRRINVLRSSRRSACTDGHRDRLPLLRGDDGRRPQALGQEGTVATRDIAELVAEALQDVKRVDAAASGDSGSSTGNGDAAF